MKLEQAQELYSDYMEGALSPAMHLALEQHFERDAEAREDYKAFHQLINTFANVEVAELEAPSGLRASILERVSLEASPTHQKQSNGFADTLRSWFAESTLRRVSSLGLAVAAVGAVTFAGFHGHGSSGPASSGAMVPTIMTPSVTSTVLGVGMKSGDDGNQYHLFKIHLPPSISEATVTAQVLSDPSQIADQDARNQQARPALKQPFDLTNDEELDIPVALLQAVPADSTITVLVQWQPTDNQPSGEQVVFTPATPDAVGATSPVGPDSAQGFYEALQYISSAYHVTVISDTSAPQDLTVNPWSATVNPLDALNSVALSGGYHVRQIDGQTYQFYK
jgi:hypothetical protein